MQIDIIGYCAICIGAISLTPQIIQMIKTKKVRDINIYFLFISIISDILYFLYSILSKNNFMFYSMFPPVLSHLIMLFLWFIYNKSLNNEEYKNNIENNTENNTENNIENNIEIIII